MRTIIINNPGPQGATGPQGAVGPTGSAQPFSNVSGSIWATTSSLEVSGSFTISGSSTFTNIGPAVFSGSINTTGDITVLGTASISTLQINSTLSSTGSISGGSFIKIGGTNSQFLKADGSVDSSSYTPTSRTITINGTTQDLSADRSFTIDKVSVGLGNVDNTSDANKPISTTTQTALNAKQDTLVSGTNIKTINGNSVLGNGDLVINTINTLDQVTTAGNATTNNINIINSASGAVNSFLAADSWSTGQFKGIVLSHYNTGVATNQWVSPNTNALVSSVHSSGMSIVHNGTGNISFWTGVTATEKLRMFNNGNIRVGTPFTDFGFKFDVVGTGRYTGILYLDSKLIIGSYTDAGFRLDVNGTARIKGTGATSATTALRIENTNTSASLVVLDSGFVGINTGSAQYNLDVNGTARVQTTLTAGQNIGNSYNHLFDAGLGGITFRRFDSYGTPNFITITQPNYGTSVSGSMLYITTPSNTKAFNFANLKLTGPYAGGGSTFLQVGSTTSANSSHVSLAKFHTGNLTYIGPTYGGATTYMGLDIKVEGQTADYSVSASTNFAGIYIQSNFNNAFSAISLPIGSWKTFTDKSTLSNLSTPFTSVDIAPTFTNASNVVTSYGININPTLNSYTGFVALNILQGKSIFGGTGNVLIGTTTDVASSKLTIESTTQGFLPPRMTTTQKNAIATPAAGLMVYDTDLSKVNFYNGASWNNTGLGVAQVTPVTLASGSWSLVSSLYEYDYSNALITSSSIVDIIPDNSTISIVQAAQVLPSTVSTSGSVKLFATNLPTADIIVTVNIFN